MNPFVRKHKGTRFNNKGQAMIELGLVFPILMMFLFFMAEGWNIYNTAQRLSSLSREVGNASYRECTFLNQPFMNNCLSDVVNRANALAEGVLRDFGDRGTVISSIYEPTPSNAQNPPVKLMGRRFAGGGHYQSNYQSTYQPGHMIREFVIDQETIAIAEIFYEYRALTPIGTFFYNIVGMPGVINEVTVY